MSPDANVIDTLFPEKQLAPLTRRRARAIRRAQKRADHRAALAIQAMNEPDERRKVAACPRCHAWFDTIEGRNAHRAEEHGPAAEQRRAQDAADDDACESATAVDGERIDTQGATP